MNKSQNLRKDTLNLRKDTLNLVSYDEDKKPFFVFFKFTKEVGWVNCAKLFTKIFFVEDCIKTFFN